MIIVFTLFLFSCSLSVIEIWNKKRMPLRINLYTNEINDYNYDE